MLVCFSKKCSVIVFFALAGVTANPMLIKHPATAAIGSGRHLSLLIPAPFFRSRAETSLRPAIVPISLSIEATAAGDNRELVKQPPALRAEARAG
jgi:hypothetical protein